MGRPLNKKYFGNRNVGSASTSNDDYIGGEGIDSVSFSDAGSWMAVSGVPFSGLELPAPTIPGGVQATWTINYGLYQVTTGAGKAGLVVGNTYTYAAYPGSIITVASTSGSNATFTVTAEGSSTSLPTDTQGVTITKLTGGGAASFLVDVYSHIVSAPITEKGSGYTGAETFTTTRTNSSVGGIPAGTIVLTTDSGDFSSDPLVPGVNEVDNQENAIKISANIGGSGGVISDIVKQEGTRRYKVENGDGTGYVNLTTARANAGALTNGEALILAYDSAGNTYFVNKLTAHKATVYQGNGSQFANGSSVSWNFTAGVANVSVKIDNA